MTIESYGTAIVNGLDTISAMVGAIELDRQPTMQLDVLMRMQAIIDAIINGGGGNGNGNGTISPVKTYNFVDINQAQDISLTLESENYYENNREE